MRYTVNGESASDYRSSDTDKIAEPGDRLTNLHASVDLMNNNPAEDTIGELTLAETALGALIKDILSSIPDYTPKKKKWESTGQAVGRLQHLLDTQAEFLPPSVPPWLVRVASAVDQRNEVVHALAGDRCARCKVSTHFTNSDGEVNRSPERIRALTELIDTLTLEGLALSVDISELVNLRYLNNARSEAARTGMVQTPPQISIGLPWHVCGNCTGTGTGAMTIALPTVVVMFPPGTDIAQLLRPRSASHSQPGEDDVSV